MNAFYGINTGTTIIAMEYAEGVVIAADSRTSCDSYVSNRVADKLTPITRNIYCCRSGSAAQTQALSKQIATMMRLHQFASGELPRVSDVAVSFRNVIYKYRDYRITGILVAGWDPVKGGQVFSLPVTGLLVHEPYAIGGSGSTFIHGFLSSQYRRDLSLDELIAVAIKAVRIAILHDCSSGGVVRIGVIDKDGIRTAMVCQHDPDLKVLTKKMSWDVNLKNW